MKRKPKILVVGSLVMDLIVTTDRFPNAGETVIGCGFSTAPGGKGANQAVQAARLGADVVMFGKVGNDEFGRQLIESLKNSGVDTSRIGITSTAPSGIGNVQLECGDRGTENRIVVVPGANMEISLRDIAPLEREIAEFDMVILQNEIPTKINTQIAIFAEQAGVPVMLNPAPSKKLPQELISRLTYISPNEHEAEDLVGIAPIGKDGVRKAALRLCESGGKNVVMTLGKNGSAYSDGSEVICKPIMDCGRVLDPTAAGDSYVGAFCVAVAAGASVFDAMTFATCAAGITVSKLGAQPSLPTLDEVAAMLKTAKADTCPSFITEE